MKCAKKSRSKEKNNFVLFPTWIFCFLFFLSVTNKQTAAHESIQICQVAMTIVKLILIKCPFWVGRATCSNRGPQVLSGGWQESQYFPSNSLKRSLNCCYLECWDSKRGKPYIKAHSQRSPLRKTAHSPGICLILSSKRWEIIWKRAWWRLQRGMLWNKEESWNQM